jgi:hypothetical protein
MRTFLVFVLGFIFSVALYGEQHSIRSHSGQGIVVVSLEGVWEGSFWGQPSEH